MASAAAVEWNPAAVVAAAAARWRKAVLTALVARRLIIMMDCIYLLIDALEKNGWMQCVMMLLK